MRVVCLIESLGGGGAERQICTLAGAMKQAGIDVSVFSYAKNDFYLPLLTAAGIPHRLLNGYGKIGRLLAVRHALRSGQQDAVLAFLTSTCNYAELAGIPSRRWGLVVSERLAIPENELGNLRFKWKLHSLADYVTSNSHSNRMLIEKAVPKLRGRVATIYNIVDMERFRPRNSPLHHSSNELRFVVAASYLERKNIMGLIRAVAELQRRGCTNIHVDWYGRKVNGSPVLQRALDLIREHHLNQMLSLHDATRDIAAVYHQADAILLPSFYEGLPNTVCEAMACGKPILMSDVCDARYLVHEGENGFHFDPSQPASIATAIERFAGLNGDERVVMGLKSREMAEDLFNADKITSKYLELLETAATSPFAEGDPCTKLQLLK